MHHQDDFSFDPSQDSPPQQRGLAGVQRPQDSAIKQIFDITKRSHALIYSLSDKVAAEKVHQAKIRVKQVIEF